MILVFAKVVAACVIGIPLALFALVLLLFLLFQVFDTWRKEGVLSACAITFTSLVLFPPLAVVETVEACLFPASMPERKDDADLQPLLEGGLQASMEGIVWHRRSEQAVNELRYHVRYVLLLLDAPPPSFKGDYLTADQARGMAGTDGPVLLLTDPSSAGYHQNPISVYYCYERGGGLNVCVAEVTNTPWGEKVAFPFAVGRDTLPKAMHVSPFMDMNRCWRLEASQPADLANKPPSLSAAVFKLRGDVSLSVTTVPNCPGGSEFVAMMKVRPTSVSASPTGWLSPRTWLMPQRVAIRIYWHALKLVAKGVRYVPHPRELNAEAYEILMEHPGPAAVVDSAIPGRKVEYQDWNGSQRISRASFCPLGFTSAAPPSTSPSTHPSLRTRSGGDPGGAQADGGEARGGGGGGGGGLRRRSRGRSPARVAPLAVGGGEDGGGAGGRRSRSRSKGAQRVKQHVAGPAGGGWGAGLRYFDPADGGRWVDGHLG